MIRASGAFVALTLDTLRAVPRRPFHWREFLQQAWFIVSVSALPTALVSIPFGAVLALQAGNLIRQFGAQSFTGATAVLGIVREASPVVTALMISGAAGSAICADLGARKIREEIDALEVLGIDPLHRLVVPRVAACAVVAPLLNGLVTTVGLIASYLFNVIAQGGSPGSYLQSFNALAELSDLWISAVKALVFGATAGMIACFKGLSAAGGPKGVGDAVNQTVVFAAMVLFAENFLISAAVW
ncbi:MlaE family ABC transporter permease [Nonomuraea endophytica]|uniref:Phospholipid/cholesterol/gamma-HCH transport system permease protein n=1 Tax=Nonomuraea endophytica TaxID=714136 RepID=A0A7W7ZYF0_9ACTN|nr:ABC transporter permease [Nonomuraea endophytica]MBB5075138.1 phospholipid/cholesterol/gamma-HCH transport system permease protein [Nonomuraea endophytica]